MLEKLEPVNEQDPAQGRMRPRMRVMMDDPEKYFYYSKVCSMCGTSNVPPTKQLRLLSELDGVGHGEGIRVFSNECFGCWFEKDPAR